MAQHSYKIGEAPWETGRSAPKSFPVGQAPWEVQQAPAVDENMIGSIPVIDQLANVGVGIGSSIGKAGLGLGQTFLKGANVISNIALNVGLSDAPKDQFNQNIDILERGKEKVFTEPFKQRLDTISGKTGEFVGATVPFFATGGAVTKSQQFLQGATQKTVQSLAKQEGVKRVLGSFVKGATDVLPEAVVQGATEFGVSGGDVGRATFAGVGAGLFSGLTHVGSGIFRAVVPQTAKEATARALGFSRKMTLKDAATGKQLNDSIDALTTLNNLADDIKVFDENGIEKTFVPTQATITELPQALYQAKNKVYDMYSKIAEEAGDAGASVGQKDFNRLISSLDKYSEAGYTESYSNKARQIVNSIMRYGKVNPRDGAIYFPNVQPARLQKLVESINKDVNPGSDAAGAIVARDASQTLRAILDDKIAQATGEQYQTIRNAYEQLKVIEQPIINLYKKVLRSSGMSLSNDWVNGISAVDAIMGLVSMNPEQLARAGATQVVKKLIQKLRIAGTDPEVNLQRAFKLLRGEADAPASSLKARFTNTPENTEAFRAGQKFAEDNANLTPKQRQAGFINPSAISKSLTSDIPPAYKETGKLTTKILKDLEGKTTVSKQYILDATNRGELKQVERDLIRQALEKEGATVNVADFAKKVKAELLPLKVKSTKNVGEMKSAYGSGLKYENIALPSEVRGKVKNYDEHIYESPIKTSAGSTHFENETDNYFGHTRIEDMADNKTRRVIEVQSDLFQKGNLDREKPNIFNLSEQDFEKVLSKSDIEALREARRIKSEGYRRPMSSPYATPEYKKRVGGAVDKIDELEKKAYQIINKDRTKELSKLQQYNDPTAHFRMIREEIKKASLDGKTKLQFPTGETAMKIEGLGRDDIWSGVGPVSRQYPFGHGIPLNISDLKVGKELDRNLGDRWIITDVLGDGKFKAMPKDLESLESKGFFDDRNFNAGVSVGKIKIGNKTYYYNKETTNPERLKETFDISGKVDTENPIYRFYEKEMQKYLNKFGGKRVVDDKGVSWIEVPITKEQGKMPVEAFGLVGLTGLGTMEANNK